MFADLHTHTNFSDGIFSPEEVVAKATAAALKAIAITDHDTVDGIAKAQIAAENIEIIPGVEVSSSHKNNDVHILGYFIDPNNAELLENLALLRNARVERFKLIIARLYDLGIKLDITVENDPNSALGRAHIAYAMVAAGIVSGKQQAFDRYIGFGKPAYVPRINIDPIKAINLILIAKGVPVLAHPGVGNNNATFINELANAGLKGLEVYHPSHKKNQIKTYNKIANKNNLIATGGSDFHGSTTEYASKIGYLAVAYSVVEEMKKLASD